MASRVERKNRWIFDGRKGQKGNGQVRKWTEREWTGKEMKRERDVPGPVVVAGSVGK
jgi:hypothetical protein